MNGIPIFPKARGEGAGDMDLDEKMYWKEVG